MLALLDLLAVLDLQDQWVLLEDQDPRVSLDHQDHQGLQDKEGQVDQLDPRDLQAIEELLGQVAWPVYQVVLVSLVLQDPEETKASRDHQGPLEA